MKEPPTEHIFLLYSAEGSIDFIKTSNSFISCILPLSEDRLKEDPYTASKYKLGLLFCLLYILSL